MQFDWFICHRKHDVIRVFFARADKWPASFHNNIKKVTITDSIWNKSSDTALLSQVKWTY